MAFFSRQITFDDSPQSLRVYDDNVVSFAKKVNFDIGCQMDFHMYPIDLQKCPVNIQSFRYRPQVTLNFWGSS